MILFLLIGAIAFLTIIFATLFVWEKVKFNWLTKISRYLIWALPFERIPSFSIGPGEIRISYILVLIGFWIMLILFLKRDELLLKCKFNNLTLFLLVFLIFSFISWPKISNLEDFIVNILATLIVFGGSFLVANFSLNILDTLKELIWVMLFVCLFAGYQFVGDLAGLPPSLTGLRPNYISESFLIPRVHATAIEPLHFAGMLFLPILTSLTFILSKKTILPKKITFKYANILILFILTFTLLLTISKSAYFGLAIGTTGLIIFAFKPLKIQQFIVSSSTFLLSAVGGFYSLFLISDQVKLIVEQILEHILEVISFEDVATVSERINYLEAAWIYLLQNPIQGIGPGQYAHLATKILDERPLIDASYIVNNIYIEVWLEHGLSAFLIFLVIFCLPLVKNLKIFFQQKNWLENSNQLARLIVTFALIAYLIQWNFFSPIYIMPIFLILGLAWNLSERDIREI